MLLCAIESNFHFFELDNNFLPVMILLSLILYSTFLMEELMKCMFISFKLGKALFLKEKIV